jgi:hypothetical protein
MSPESSYISVTWNLQLHLLFGTKEESYDTALLFCEKDRI